MIILSISRIRLVNHCELLMFRIRHLLFIIMTQSMTVADGSLAYIVLPKHCFVEFVKTDASAQRREDKIEFGALFYSSLVFTSGAGVFFLGTQPSNSPSTQHLCFLFQLRLAKSWRCSWLFPRQFFFHSSGSANNINALIQPAHVTIPPASKGALRVSGRARRCAHRQLQRRSGPPPCQGKRAG